MNTQDRLILINKFISHIDKKTADRTNDKNPFQNIQEQDLDIGKLPKIQIVSELSDYHRDISRTIKSAHDSVQDVAGKLNCLKNKKQNITNFLDSLTSIQQVKQFSYKIDASSEQDPSILLKNLTTYYMIKPKVYYVDKFIKDIQGQIDEIQVKYKKQFDSELVKNNSSNIAEVAKVLELIKTNRKKPNISQNQPQKGGQGNSISESASSSTTNQIAQFYIEIVKKQLMKFEEDLFNIPIIGIGNEFTYIFFQIAKNSLKVVTSMIQTYKNNILKLSSQKGLHEVIVKVFNFVMENLLLQILVRQKRYYQIDKISITRTKLTLKDSQYNILKCYFKQFNAIWNQIQRFRLHLYKQLPQTYANVSQFNKQLIDTTNSVAFVDFNYNIILYFQAFFRHQLNKLLKKSSFILSIWQLDNEFFKEVRQKNQYIGNPAGQDFIEQMIVEFADGVSKLFQTLNMLIISALINFVNHNLIYEDSFYAFNQLFTRCVSKIVDPKAIQGIILIFNTLYLLPKGIKMAFQEIQIPEQLPTERIKNQISQLIFNNTDRSYEFINELFNRLLQNQYIYDLLKDDYAGLIQKFINLQPQILQKFMQKLSKEHAQILLNQEFKRNYNHSDVLSLQKEVRGIISKYEEKSHSIRQNFRKVLDYIEVLLTQNESQFSKTVKLFSNRYEQEELRKIWKLRVK